MTLFQAQVITILTDIMQNTEFVGISECDVFGLDWKCDSTVYRRLLSKLGQKPKIEELRGLGD